MIRSDKQHLFPERKRVEGREGESWQGGGEGRRGRERGIVRRMRERERSS